MIDNVFPLVSPESSTLHLPEPPERARQIFANRDLRFDQIDLIGFDMDYTLAVYRKVPMESLAHRLTVERLVHKHGYPEEILGFKYDPGFVIRGLIVDKTLGNIVKIDRFNHVGRGYHGRREMTKEERRQVYRNESIRLSNPRYYLVDTLFALPEVCLLADLIDFYEARAAGGGDKVNYEQLFQDIRTSIDEVHQDDSLKGTIIAHPEQYLERDEELAHALHKLRSSGKKLFVLTNSLWNYTDPLMRYLLDGVLPQYPSWRNYFDAVIVGARKPMWFTSETPLVELNVGTEGAPGDGKPSDKPVEKLARGRVYQSGNLREFEKLMVYAGEKILYIGDHIYGDILKTKKSGLWRTALVVSELEDELRLADKYAAELAELHQLEDRRSLIDQELLYNKTMLTSLERVIDGIEPAGHKAERERLIVMAKETRRDRDEMKRVMQETLEKIEALTHIVENEFNSCWGLVFKEGHENTRFGAQVADYACVYTSRVSNFLAYSPLQYFRAPRALMTHER